MNKKEVSEIFSLWSLNWPSAEMFQGGAEVLNARITLFANRFKDVSYWYGRQGALVSIDTRKFPPSIAEYREDIDKVISDTKQKIDLLYEITMRDIRLAKSQGQPIESVINDMLPAAREIIDRMGGIKALVPENQPFPNAHGFEEAYLCLQIEKDGSASSNNRRLPPKKG